MEEEGEKELVSQILFFRKLVPLIPLFKKKKKKQQTQTLELQI